MRIQHALRAFTPRDKKAVKAVAETFRQNPDLDTVTVITELGIGEALVSTLDAKGAPTVVQRVYVAPPRSRIGPVESAERQRLIASSPISGRYEQVVDRESAYERLKQRAEADVQELKIQSDEDKVWQTAKSTQRRPVGRPRDSLGETMLKSVARSVTTTIGGAIGRKLVRGLLGSLLGGK